MEYLINVIRMLKITKYNIYNVILLHPVALCIFDLGIMIPSGATTIYIEGLLLEDTVYSLTDRGWETNDPHTRPEAKAVHRIAATAATLPSYTWRWPVRPKHVVTYNIEKCLPINDLL
jgi:hypothetical protein